MDRSWVVVTLVAVTAAMHAGAVEAQSTGFLQSGSGPWLYTSSTNWVGGTINGVWDSSLTLAAPQTVQFDEDTVLGTGLTFNQGGGSGLTLKSSSATTRTLTLGGNVSMATGNRTGASVTIGDAANALNVDLGGVTRTVTTSNPFLSLTLQNVVSNGGLVKSGSGTLVLNGANTFTGGVTLNAGVLSLGNAAALGDSSSTFTIAGGRIDNTSGGALTISNNNPQAWNAGFVFVGSQNLNLGTGAVTLGTSLTATTSASTLTVGGAIAGSGFALRKAGAGQLTLNSAAKSTFNGGLALLGGTLRLDFANATTPGSGLVDNANTLTLEGGNLTVVAKSNANSAQTLGAVTINTGRAVVTVNGNGSGRMVLTTGAWTRNAGGTLNVVLGTSGTLTASPSTTNGIIGPWASIGSTSSTRYATVSGGVIASSTGAAAANNNTLIDTTGTMNYELAAASSSSNPAVSMSANTIRYSGGSGTTAPQATLSINGLMNVGTGTWTIGTGTGTVTVGSTRELVVNAANNQITISGRIANNSGGASSVVKDGVQTLVLSGANTHSGGTVLNSGTLRLGNNAALGSGTFTINGGTLNDNGNTFSSSNTVSIVINGNFSKADANRTITLGSGTVTLNRPVTVTIGANAVQFNGPISGPGSLNGLDITPNSSNNGQVILQSGITLRGNQIVTTQGSSGRLTLNGVLSDGGSGYGFTVDGNGATGGVTLGPVTHTFSGPIVLVRSGGLNVTGEIAPSSITINGGSTLTLGDGDTGTAGRIAGSTTMITDGTLLLGQNRLLTQGTDFPSLITGTGGVSSGNRGTILMSAQNTYGGGTTLKGLASVLLGGNPVGSVGNLTSSPVGTGVVTFSGGGMQSDGAAARSILNSVAFTSSGATLGDATNSGQLTFMGPISFGDSRGMLTISSTVNFSNTTTGSTGGGAAGGGGFTKAGAGTLILSGSNTFPGGVTLSAGILRIASDSSLGTYAPFTLNYGELIGDGGTLQFAAGSSVAVAGGRPFMLNSGTTLTIDTSLAAGTIDSTIRGAGSLVKTGADSLTLNAENTFTGTTTISDGSIRLGTARALQYSQFNPTDAGAGVGLDVNGATTLTIGGLTGDVNLASAVIGYSGLTGLTLDRIVTGSTTYSGVIADPGVGQPLAVTKNGGGTQVLSGANTYTGATTVNAGWLQVTGTIADGSAVTVSGGAIGGTGRSGGTLTLSGTGGIDLRDASVGTGTLTIGGKLAIDGAAGRNRLIFDVGGSGGGVDRIVVGGAATMTTSGAAVISVSPTVSNRIDAGTYDLIQAAGGVPDAANFTLPTTRAFGLGLALQTSGSALQLVTTQSDPGPGSTSWNGTSNATWTTAANWSTALPSYQSNVTLYNTAANLSTTLGADFDVNSLSFPAGATSPMTVGGATMLTIEAQDVNGSTAGTGITVATPSSGTPVAHTISANVGLARSQSWTVSNNATLTVSGTVTDFGLGRTLTKEGSGLLNLNGAVQVGGLAVGYGQDKVSGTVVFGAGSSLAVGYGASDAVYIGTGPGGASGNASGFVDASAASSVTVNVGNFKVGGTGLGIGNVGTLALGRSNMITAATQFAVCNGDYGEPNSYGTVTTAISSTTAIYTPLMYVGYNIGNSATGGWGRFYSGTGSTVTVSGIDGGRTGVFVGVIGGGGPGGGENAPSELHLAADGSAVADLRLSSLTIGQIQGSSFVANGNMTLGTSPANRLDVRALGSVVLIGDNNGSSSVGGTLTIGNAGSSSAVVSTDNATAILLGSKRGSGGVTGTLNLGSGTLTVTTTGIGIGGGGGTSTLNMIGATLKAGTSSATFITGLSDARIFAGGVAIDTGGNDVGVPQALVVAPSATAEDNSGLPYMAWLAPTAAGSGYTSAPSATFTAPSGGTAPTGVVQINAAGEVTGILITNPGSGYVSGSNIAVSLTGGGGSGAAFANATASVFQGGGGLTKAGAGTLLLTGSNTYSGTTTINAGTLQVGDGGTTGSLGQGMLITGSTGGLLVFNRSNTFAQGTDFAIEIAGGVGVTQLGTGTLSLSGGILAPNSYTGGTRISNGTLRLTGDKGLPSKSAVTLGTGSTSGILDLNTFSATLGSVTFDGTGSQVLPGGTLNLEVNSGSAAILVNSGSHAIRSNASLVSNTVINTAAGSSLSLGGAIDGPGGLTKLGVGLLTLSAVQTYAGNTVIAGGTLALASGASLASSSIKAGDTAGGGGTFDVTDLSGGLQLASGQTLGGHGTVRGNVVVGAGSFIAPGGSIGTLTQTGTQTWAPLGAYTFQVTNAGGTAGGGWDLLNVDALQITASSGAGNQFVVGLQSLMNGSDNVAGPMSGGNWNPNTSYQWKFVVANAPISSFDAAWFNVDTSNFQNTFNAGGFSVARGDQVGGQTNELYVVYAAVPEPGTLALAGIGLGALALWTRRRRDS